MPPARITFSITAPRFSHTVAQNCYVIVVVDMERKNYDNLYFVSYL